MCLGFRTCFFTLYLKAHMKMATKINYEMMQRFITEIKLAIS